MHVSRNPLFSPEECQKVIDEVEEVAAARGWTTRRHFGACLYVGGWVLGCEEGAPRLCFGVW